jgi:hypothetical protein
MSFDSGMLELLKSLWYWVQYLNTKSFPTARGDYKLLTTVDAPGKQLMAVDADVVPGPMQGWPPFPFALTPKARQRRAVTLKVDTVHYTSAQIEPDAFGSDFRGPGSG